MLFFPNLSTFLAGMFDCHFPSVSLGSGNNDHFVGRVSWNLRDKMRNKMEYMHFFHQRTSLAESQLTKVA
jgi:hypothetical protein